MVYGAKTDCTHFLRSELFTIWMSNETYSTILCISSDSLVEGCTSISRRSLAGVGFFLKLLFSLTCIFLGNAHFI